jgi:hypothetical protein
MKILMLYFIFCFTGNSVQAQGDPEKALNKLKEQLPKQKFYFHFDKPAYFSGENIWFKGYVFSGSFPDNESRNLFVRLVDRKGNIIQERKYPVLGATVAGNFYLADSLPADEYYIYAFTPTVLNDDNSAWFKKTISILNRNTILMASDPSDGDTVSIRFFPEGGKLVSGIKTNIAFEALGENGLPVSVSFKIRNAEGAEIKRVNSIHDGIGKFDLNPMENTDYRIQLTEPVNKVLKYSFPEIETQGLCLQLESDGRFKRYTITKTKSDTGISSVRLLVHKNHETIFNRVLYFNNATAVTGSLETSQLPSGILHFTLFGNNDLPIAERLIFVHNNEFISPATINWNKKDFDKRKKNELELVFEEKIQVSCSIAITDLHAVIQNEDQENIFSSMLLTNDVKGAVFNPSWYFQNNSDSVLNALDLLLMTHGWKHFTWTDILNDRFFKKAPNDNPFITISGNVYSIPDNKPLHNGSLSMIFKLQNGETVYESTPVNADGSFIIDSLITRGPTQVLFTYINTYNETIKASIKINVDSLNYWTNTTDQFMNNDIRKINTLLPGQSKKSMENILTKSNYVYKESNWGNGKIYKGETVTIKGKKSQAFLPKNLVDARYSSGAFTSPSRKMLDLINEPHYNPKLSVWNYLKVYLPVDVVDGGGNLQIVSRTQFSLNSGKKWPVAVYLDENELGQGNGLRILQDIPIEEIGLVKYWAIGFVGAVGNAPGGAIAIYTKKPGDNFKPVPSPLNKFSFDGYSVLEEFYSPDYSIKDKRHSATDTRTTLFWSPNIITDGLQNKVTVHFYNNDFTNSFKLVLEGFSENGKLIHEERIITKD